VPFLLFKGKDLRASWKNQTNEKIVLLSSLSFMIVFFIASLFLFHGADPKYLLLIAFPCSVLSIRLLELSSKRIKLLTTLCIIFLIPIYMSVFSYRSYNIELERRMGVAIANELDLDKSYKIWSDYPTVLLYSKWDPKKAVSTESILKNNGQNDKITSSTLLNDNIQYLIVANSDRSRVLEFFPFLNPKDSLKFENIEFTLIHEEKPYKHDGFRLNANIFDQLKTYVISTNRTISLWEIKSKDL
jgi:hypothetical protein